MRRLVLFAKQPVAGRAKTRLARETSPTFAAALAEAFLCDSVARFSQVAGATLALAFDPPESETWFASTIPGVELWPQGDGDLGVRLARGFDRAFAEGASHVAVVGSDSPTLPLARIADAFDSLATCDVAVVPATDGGYCLLALRRPMPELFDGIAWSGPTVLSETIARVRGPVAALDSWYDVDTLADLATLIAHLKTQRASGVACDVPHTEALLRSFVEAQSATPTGASDGASA